MEVINTRRSVRSYQDRQVEEEKIELLLRAAMQAPSAMNQQPWEFIVVEDRAILKGLSEKLTYGKMLAEAPLAIILLANTKSLKSPLRWPQDMAAASENILLQATKLGLGSVWVSLYPDDEREGYVREILGVKEPLVPFNIISIGYPKEKMKFIDRFDRNKIHRR
ncbi:MAG: nitroreductase family protein [Tissierellia bacterium]|nr:nitroreductase family protein [Tissierellia bacterium]